MAIRVYADDTFRVPLGTSGTDAVLLAHVLQLDGGGSEEMIVPIFAAVEVGDRPAVGDYTGTLSIDLNLDPVEVGKSIE